jgi:uncharacterized protein (TIGR00369 family)
MVNDTDAHQWMQRIAEAAEASFWGYLGCRLESMSEKSVTISLEVKPHHLNIIGIVHGGVLSSLLDNAMGVAVMSARPDEHTVTTNLNVHFVAPMKQTKLMVMAEIVHESRKMITTQGTITDREGNISTIGTGSFRVI